MKYQEHNYASSELEYKHFVSPAIEDTMVDITLEKGASILDLGCGPGATIPYLAKLSSGSTVTGLDGSVSHLKAAKRFVKQQGLVNPVTLVKHDLFKSLPFDDQSFDLVWISDVLFPDDTGRATFDILLEALRVLKENGQLVIFYGNWLRLTLMPGFSLLENSIHAANELSKSTRQDWDSQLHPEKCANWLLQTGFKEVKCTVKPFQYNAPLEPRIKQYIHWHINHIYRKAISFGIKTNRFSPGWKSTFEKVMDSESDDFLLNDPFYWCEVAPVVAMAKKPA